jgi:hypothetical protein
MMGSWISTRLDKRTSLSLPGPPSASRGSSQTLIGASPCLISDSKKAMPSSAGVRAVVGGEEAEPEDLPNGMAMDPGPLFALTYGMAG